MTDQTKRAVVEQRLQNALAARFGEDISIPEGTQGLDALLVQAEHRSLRAYADRPVSGDLLRLICAVALSAPSKSDLQQADIIMVEETAQRQAIAELIPTMPWVGAAPAFLVVCGNGERLLAASRLHGVDFANRHMDQLFNASVDAALVLQNLITAADAVGLGSCPISVLRNHAPVVDRILTLPDFVFPVAGLCLGWPDGARTAPVTRLSLSQTLHTGRHGGPAGPEALDAYDRRRGEREGFDPNGPDFRGWSQQKAEMYAEPQRTDWGAYLTSKGFRLT